MEWLAAGPDGRSPQGGRKVRTPQGSVPDNVREAGFKPGRRKVPQKTYRPVVAVGPFYSDFFRSGQFAALGLRATAG